MMRICVVANQFTTRSPALNKQFFAIATWHGIADIYGAGRQLNGFARGGMEKSAMFIQNPEVGGVVALCLKDEVFSIGSPFAAALVRCGVPTREQGMQIGSVRRSLPNGTIIGVGIVDCEAQYRAIV